LISQPWQLTPALAVQASGTLSAFRRQTPAEGHLSGSLRLLSEWLPASGWVWGNYAEHTLSSLSPDFFARAEVLQPRAGSYLIWQVSPQLALGSRLEWQLPAQRLSQWEGLLTLREGLWTLNLWLQGFPPGIQLQLHTQAF
jgi:hypothetical protein